MGYSILIILVITIIGNLVKYLINKIREAKIPRDPKSHKSVAGSGESRTCSSELQNYISILSQRIGQPYPAFRLKNFENLFDKLTYEARNPAAVRQAAQQVLQHFGIDPNYYQIEVDYKTTESLGAGGTRGTFSRGTLVGGTIRIVIEPIHSEYDTVIAIIFHECTHAFLALRGLEMDRVQDNERFTDTAAIFLGGAGYILRGYFPSSAYRLGYLEKAECESVQALCEKMTCVHAENERLEKTNAFSEWCNKRQILSTLTQNIEQCIASLHPADVVREASVQNELYALWQEIEPLLTEASRLVSSLPNAESASLPALREGIAHSDRLTTRLDAIHNVLSEWYDAQHSQSLLPKAVLDNARGIDALAQSGNAFAVLERIRLWSACPATRRDAQVYYQRLLDDSGANALCALGICHLEGLLSEKNENTAREYFTRAASMGSGDAERLLREHFGS